MRLPELRTRLTASARPVEFPSHLAPSGYCQGGRFGSKGRTMACKTEGPDNFVRAFLIYFGGSLDNYCVTVSARVVVG